MSTFDGTGLVIDRLADIKEGISDELKDAFGTGINLAETSPFGILIGIFSERYFLLYELLESVYQASFPNTSFGVYLDELSAFNGIVREAATFSTVDLRFTRSNANGDGPVVIPAGTQVTSGQITSTVVWITDIEATILNLTSTVIVSATANELGSVGALAGSLTNMLATPTNVGSVTNDLDATLGEDEESDSELKIRREQQLGAAGTSTASGIVGALTLLDEVRNATLISNDTDLIVDGRPPHSFEAFIAKDTNTVFGQEATLLYDAPLVAANFIDVTIDAVPIAGSPIAFDTSNNITLQIIATLLQADPLISQASISGTDTVIIVGGSDSDVVIASVVTGGASQAGAVFTTQNSVNATNINAVAQSLWNSKAAGIQTVGTIQGAASDIEGDTHTLFFSEIVDVRLYLRIILVTNPDYVQALAEPAILEGLVAFGLNVLQPGADVINYQLVAAVSNLNIVGIDTIAIDSSIDNITYNDSNISIDVSEFASISSSDISFLY